MTAPGHITKVARTDVAVHATAQQFRGDVGALLDEGGLNRTNVAVLAGWLDGAVWELLDANEAVLELWAGDAA